MVILSTVPLDRNDVKSIRDTIIKRHELLDEIQALGDYSVLKNNYMNPIETCRYHIEIQEVTDSFDYLVYVHPARKSTSNFKYHVYEYQYSYEYSYNIPEDHIRIIDNPLRYWYYLTKYNSEDTWEYEPLDEFWMKGTRIDLDKVDGMPDMIRRSLEQLDPVRS